MLSACLFLLSLMGDDPNAKLHDLKDGTVKIATQVTVDSEHTTIKYDLGFNPVTLDTLLTEMKIDVGDDAKYKDKVEKLRSELSKKISSTLKIEIDEEEAKAVKIKTEPDELSKHVQISISLIFDTPQTTSFDVKVTDAGFQNQSQIYTSGFKTKSPDLAVVESSTEAITLRSKPTEKTAEEMRPFVITGRIKWLKSDATSSHSEETATFTPLIVVAFSLGAAGIAGLLLVPNDLASSSDHGEHH